MVHIYFQDTIFWDKLSRDTSVKIAITALPGVTFHLKTTGNPPIIR